jgi:hypothetical protein
MLFLNKNYISHAYLYHYFDIVYTYQSINIYMYSLGLVTFIQCIFWETNLIHFPMN